jgi:hypothetical protein
MSTEDIELSADWLGEEGAFVRALVEVRFLDGEDGAFRLHDWEEHNPWAAGTEMRSAKARWNAVKRHHGTAEADRLVPEYSANRNATSSTDSNAGDTSSNPVRSAPSLTPSPSLTPIQVKHTESESEPESRASPSESARSPPENSDGIPPPTKAGAICCAIRSHGIAACNPSHPKLAALIEAGAELGEFDDAARDGAAKGKGFAWVLGAVEGRRRDAASAANGIHHGQMPKSRREQRREWNQQLDEALKKNA